MFEKIAKVIPLFIIVMSCALLILSPQVMASQRVALVIGNSSYKTVPLENPVNDAVDIAKTLEKYDFDVILKTDVNLRQTENAMKKFYKKLQKSDVGFFFYAGHGVQVKGMNYLIPLGADVTNPNSLKYKAIPTGQLLGMMEDAGNKLNIVVLDACRNNPFRSYFRSAQKGLASMDTPDGSIVAYATAPNSVAADGAGRNGLYTSYLLKNMARPEINLLQVFNQTGLQVRNITKGEQRPWVSFSPMENFYLAGGNPGANLRLSDAPKNYNSEPGIGVLKVTSTPGGASITLDGDSSGKTPLQLGNVGVGQHLIAVAKSGYQREEQRVEIKAGRRAVIHFDLDEVVTTGWLTVRTSPSNARVRILNITPVYQSGMELEAGRYHLEVSFSGYESEKRWVELAPGDDLQVDFSLSQKRAVVAQAKAQSDSRNYRDPTTGMDFVHVAGGCFQMGSPASEKDRDSDEGPQHRVCVDDLYVGTYEVTVGQWRKFIGESGYRTDAEKDTNEKGCWGLKENKWGYQDGYDWQSPGFTQSDHQPVACVSHNDVVQFISWLKRKTGKSYRLPTEAEWEYAARAGTTGSRFWGSGESEACKYANVADKGKNWSNYFPCDDGYIFSSPVGHYKANGFGLYDMLGNVWEWTGDWYGKDYYSSSPTYNPQGPGSGSSRVNRGGSWSYRPALVRSANRAGARPWRRVSGLGFRLVLAPSQR